MQKNISICLFVFFCIITNGITVCQSNNKAFFKPSDTINNNRLLLASTFTFCTYSAFSIGLYNAWYKKHRLSKFHYFDDFGEWQHMDKFGHIFNGYFQSDLCSQGAKWIGINHKKSILIGVGISQLFQTTLELLDGHSEDWGFSWSDIGANIIGSTFFLSQDLLWNKQKVLLKFSSFPVNYISDDGIQKRVSDIYGSQLVEKLLKDYNAQTYWLSLNPNLFIDKSNWPQYLNIAIGYGSNGLYGAYKNEWFDSQGNKIMLDPQSFPRLHQYYLSFDLDLRKIKVKNHFLKTSLRILNIFKFPSPTLEFRSNGRIKGHWLHF